MRLEIDRLSLDCLVGGDHPDPHGARDRVVALSRRLPHELGEQVRPFSGGDEIVLVRSLELDLTFDLDGPETANLARWSRAFAAQLACQLSAQGQGVVRFADRAEQLACFVRDLVAGDAWSLWFHRPFAGLRALPTARALATALGAEPVRGQAALALLDEDTIAKAGELLGAEADHLAETLCADIPDGAAAADLVAPLCEAALRHLSSPGPRLLATLKAHAARTGRPCGPGDLALCRTVVEVLAGEGGQPEGPAASPERGREPGRSREEGGAPVPPDVTSEVARQVRRYAKTAKVRRLGTLFGGPLLLLRDLDRVDLGISPEGLGGNVPLPHRVSLAGNSHPRHPEEPAERASRRTHNALACFETRPADAPQHDAGRESCFEPDPEAPQHEGCRDSHLEPVGPSGWPVASALRALVLAWLAGPDRGRDFLADPFWRDLLDMPPDLGPSHLIRWADTEFTREGEQPATVRQPPWPNGLGLSSAAEHHVAALAGLVLDSFAHRLPGFSQSSAAHLFTNFLDLRASILHQGDEGLTALVSRPPLDPILALSGAASWTAEFCWTRPHRISVSREAR